MPDVLRSPAQGVPSLISTAQELTLCAEKLRAGHGPIAVDTERASGFRYDERVFLIQFKRAGAGIFLIDPVTIRDQIGHILGPVINEQEWIVHAASTDLGCLYDVGLHPRSLFDTELAGRLAGMSKVNLASMVEHFLGITLLKGYGAADWSQRPLPEDWLTYAALDVEELLDLSDALHKELDKQGKLDWAREESEYIRATFAHGNPHPPKTWRDTKGISRLKNSRQLATLRALWTQRDRMARDSDVAVSRIMPDRMLIELAYYLPTTRAHFNSLAKKNRVFVKNPNEFTTTIRKTANSDRKKWPKVKSHANTSEAPAKREWEHLDKTAYFALLDALEALSRLSEDISVPVENIIRPQALRNVLWDSFQSAPLRTSQEIDAALKDQEVRDWQRELVAPIIKAAVS